MGFYRTFLSPIRFCQIPVRGRARVNHPNPITSRRNWLDLPEHLFVLIIDKLNFRDQICVLAVCKNWGACKDRVRSSKRFPWVMSHIRDSESEDHPFVCELFDPYTRTVQKVSYPEDLGKRTKSVFASKNGWFLFARTEITFTLSWHNPFTNRIKLLPYEMEEGTPFTMTAASPTSPGCEMFNLSIGYYHPNHSLIIDRCCLSEGGVVWMDSAPLTAFEHFHNILYMKGYIYCLFRSGKLYRYGLEDKSWELLTSECPEPYASWHSLRNVWLMEIKENLMMAVLDIKGKRYTWRIFRFDWSERSWVAETGLRSCAIYISGRLAFSTPLTDLNGNTLQGCRVFYHNKNGQGIKSFSLSEAGRTKKIKGYLSNEYGWIKRYDQCVMSFVEHPYFVI